LNTFEKQRKRRTRDAARIPSVNSYKAGHPADAEIEKIGDNYKRDKEREGGEASGKIKA